METAGRPAHVAATTASATSPTAIQRPRLRQHVLGLEERIWLDRGRGEPAPAIKLGVAEIGERDVTDAHCGHRHIISRPWPTSDQLSAPSSTDAWP